MELTRQYGDLQKKYNKSLETYDMVCTSLSNSETQNKEELIKKYQEISEKYNQLVMEHDQVLKYADEMQ